MYRHKAFPLTFVTSGRHLLLVGGGDGGENRLITALAFDWAKITFVATDPTPICLELAAHDPRVTIHQRPVQESDVEGVDLVIENTLDEALGRQLAAWCRPRKILLNAMDKLDYCDVYYTALIMRGPLLIAINSGGDAPALSSTLRKLLEKRIGPGWCNAAMLMAEARKSLPRSSARMTMLKSLANDEGMLDCIAANDIKGMKAIIQNAINSFSN
jgi:precorrin-2 dehydrogenase / sirohydrochlorin ferrochelatase